MEWISAKDNLPIHGLVVLGWGKVSDCNIVGFYLCGLDYERGWLQWPDLEYLEILWWTFIDGPLKQKEYIYNGLDGGKEDGA